MAAIRGASLRACAVLSALTALLAGCAAVPSPPPDRAYAGRFSATTVAGERRENVSGRFSLEIRGQQQILELASPLGTTVARVEVEPGRARATGAGMQEVQGADADALTEQLLGWPLPVSGLPDWIEGRAVQGRAARVQREGERIVLLEQDGWTIHLPEVFAGSARPRRVVLERPASAVTPSVVLRLIVDDPSG